ncbi:hypothetical protein PCE1_003015 [Barthelona sp. PCE]
MSSDKEKGNKPENEALDDEDIALFTKFSRAAYADEIKDLSKELSALHEQINSVSGVVETDTGLGPPSTWNLQRDKKILGSAAPLLVGRVSKHLEPEDPKDEHKYILHLLHSKFVVGLSKGVSEIDIHEQMRVGVERQNFAIKLPLPPVIDPLASTMQVEERPDITYLDVGGCSEQIEQVREVVEASIKHPERFANLGIDPPKGVLFYGPPGTGKTLLARAVANASDATFIRVIGSQLVQRYIGQGARLVREIFKLARSKPAAVVFFDEVDAFGTTRFSQSDSSDNEVQRTMMELLNQLDGFDPRGNVKILMATNRPDTLDPALTRPGRLDRKIEFGLPDLEGRTHIFRIHTATMSVEKGVRFDLLARLCATATGADIKSVCTEAGMFAIRDRRKIIKEEDFIAAINKVLKEQARFSATAKYLMHQ